MKFIVDAQLPFHLRDWLIDRGFDAIHTLDLPKANATKDNFIAEFADDENRIVISKDKDFFNLQTLTGKPRKLLMITTGNIVNTELFKLFDKNFEICLKFFATFDLVEMNNSFVVGHGK